jgi:DNA primase
LKDLELLKSISCVEYLHSKGIEPRNVRGKSYKYLSPWRSEAKPSFHAYKNKNTWYDFGSHEGGSVIDLVMRLEGVDFKGACSILSGDFAPKKETIWDKMPTKEPEEQAIKVLYSEKITSSYLTRYLEGRGIPLFIAQKFCKQARIEMQGDRGKYRKTVISWESDKGGCEFRNKTTKLSNSPKYLTTLNPDNKTLVLLEGFMDFLSAVTLWGYAATATYIVLNSIGHITYIDFSKYERVVYLCDNDNAGDEWFQKIEHPNKQDKRNLFQPYKDINDYLQYLKSGSIVQRLEAWGI